MFANSIFENRPKMLWVIFGLYELVLYAGLGALFTVWRQRFPRAP